MTASLDKIYLIWARRGGFDDRAEYEVCWYSTEKAATLRALALTVNSEAWRERMQHEQGNGYWEQLFEAKRALGDPSWCDSETTRYIVIEVHRGTS